jgi:hypothetical protein
VTLGSRVRVLDEELDRPERAEEADLSEPLEESDRSELSEESDGLEPMDSAGELGRTGGVVVRSFSSSWMRSRKARISSVCARRRPRMSSRVVWYSEVMGRCFSSEGTSCSGFVGCWSSSRGSSSPTRERFLGAMVCFDCCRSRFLELSKCKGTI